jgi:hypothetical protein
MDTHPFLAMSEALGTTSGASYGLRDGRVCLLDSGYLRVEARAGWPPEGSSGKHGHCPP